MGLDTESLVYVSLYFLSEVYCLLISLLLESGAIQKLSSDVPNCYDNSGRILALKKEKLGLIVPSIGQRVSADPDFFTVDRRRAGAVAASILAARTTSQPPASRRTDLRERLSRRSRRPVVDQRVTFRPYRSREERVFRSRVFTNSRKRHCHLAFSTLLGCFLMMSMK